MRAKRFWAAAALAALGAAATADARGGGAHLKSDGMALFVPASSPGRLVATEQDEVLARFAGRFTITGPYVIECDQFAEGPCTGASLEVFIQPDAQLLARLPRWEFYKGNKPLIELTGADDFIRANLTAPTLAALEKGSMTGKTGYATVVVDHLVTGVDCDSPWYSATIVSYAPVTRIAMRDPVGNRGCA